VMRKYRWSLSRGGTIMRVGSDIGQDIEVCRMWPNCANMLQYVRTTIERK